MSSFPHEIEGMRFKELRDKQLITVIRRGLSVSGVVQDDKGNAIVNAAITPDQFGVRSATKSDAQGHFTLRGVAPGARQIKAIANGFAPAMTDVLVNENIKPLDIRLSKGQPLGGRVVDPQGKPIAGVAVSLEKWCNVTFGGFSQRTDKDGRFRWDAAPADAIAFAFYKEGYLRAQAASVGNERELRGDVVMQPLVVMRGTVVDDQTGALIEKFNVHAETQHNNMFIGHEAAGVGGKFETQLSEAGELYYVRVKADGYLPAASPKVPQGTGTIEFNLRLRKGNPVTALLVQPDGAPAVGADVELNEIMAIPVTNGVMQSRWSSEAVRVKTDAAGRFTLPPREGQIKVLAIHDSGWIEIRQQAPSAEHRYVLHAWAKVEGRVMKGEQPLAGQHVVPGTRRIRRSGHAGPQLEDVFPLRGDDGRRWAVRV